MFGLKKSPSKKEEYKKPEVDLSIDQQIEGLLFMHGDEVSIADLATLFSLKKKEIVKNLELISERLDSSGLQIVITDSKALLTTRSEMSPLIESVQKKEVEGPLSPAAREVLTIVLYRSPVSRNDIDHIRGVNSTHSIRNLLIRGLIAKQGSGQNINYVPTVDTLRYLGLSQKTDLPDYKSAMKKLQEITDHHDKDPEDSGNENIEQGAGSDNSTDQ